MMPKVGKSVGGGAVVEGGTPLLGVGPLGPTVGGGPVPVVDGEGVFWGAGVRRPGQ